MAPPGTVCLHKDRGTTSPVLIGSSGSQTLLQPGHGELNTSWAVPLPPSHVSQAPAEATWPPASNPAHSRSESNTDCGWEKPVGQDDHLTLQFVLFLELLSSGCHILM